MQQHHQLQELLILSCFPKSLPTFLSKHIRSSSSSFSSSSSSPPSSLAAPSHDHIARLILDQKTPSQALQTFKWASQLPNFTHSQSTYRSLIHKLCTFRRFDSVKQLLDEMLQTIGSSPNEDIFLTIIRGLGRARMIRDVIEVTELVSKFQKTPSLKIFNAVLDVLVKENIDLAREFYRKKMMRTGVEGDDYTFGILMKGLCRTNRIGDGFKLLQIIKSRGSKPNAVIYNTLIHALCKNGKVGRARSLMNEIEEPNDVTFNILICAYCKEGNLVQSLVLLEKSFSLGFVPDVVTVTKIVDILCTVGRVSEAVEILERVESKGGAVEILERVESKGGGVDVVAYNTLIKGFCRLGKVKVGKFLLKEMERKGCLPTVDTYNTLIVGFCEAGMLDSALDISNDMKIDGISWNFITFDTLVRGLYSGGRLEDGFKILELMEESKGGSGGRVSPYNSILYGLYKKDLWNEALEFLMKMEKLFPRAVDRSLSILGFCEEGSIENAKMAYERMISEGGIASVLIYDCLIHGLCQKGYLREALDMLNEMVAHSYFPVASTYNALISEFCKQGKDGSALKLLEDMVGRGCLPDMGSFSPLIETLCRKGNFPKALSIFLQMVEKGITPNYLVWNSLLLCLTQESKNVPHVHNQIEMTIEI